MGILKRLCQTSLVSHLCDVLPSTDLRCNVKSPATLPCFSVEVGENDLENNSSGNKGDLKYTKSEEIFWNSSLWEFDKQLAKSVYSFASKSKCGTILATFFGYTCDECVWVIFPVVLASIYSIQFGTFEIFREMPCVLELLLDLFGAVVSSGFVEQILKTTFKRIRPSFVAQRTEGPWCVYGEWYSFPSGHTMRAFYLYQWIMHSTVVKAVAGIDMYSIPWLSTGLLVWCTACGWARVAAGRHFPTDVLAGAICGFALGNIVETVFSPIERYIFKCFAGIVVAIQAWFFLLQPLLTQAGCKRKAILIIRFCFFAFYIKAMFSAIVLPVYYMIKFNDDSIHLGEFSYYYDGGMYVCKRYW